MTLKEITEEYEKFKPDDYKVNSSSELYDYLMHYSDDIKQSIKAYKKELRENKSMNLEAKVRNFFFFIFQQEDASFYYYDNALIKEIIREMLLQIENIKDLVVLNDDSNYQELKRLVDFMMKHYDNNIDFLENERKRLELSLENVIYHNPLQDSRDVMKTFIEQILQAYYDKLIKVEKIYKL